MATIPAPQVMNVNEFQANQIEAAGNVLGHWIITTASERGDWKVAGEGEAVGRCLYDIAFETAEVNRTYAAIFAGVKYTPEHENYPYKSLEEARDDVIASSKELAETVRKLPEDAVNGTFEGRRGPIPGSFALGMPLSHMFYHGGQINMIQTLYGDAVFHIPGVS